MNYFTKRIWVLLLLIDLSAFSSCFGEDSILYKQKANRFDMNMKFSLRDNRGTIYLYADRLVFKTKKIKSDFMSFVINYDQIQKIRRANALIFPNRIVIKTNDGKRYGLGTYRRKRIIETTRKKMASS